VIEIYKNELFGKTYYGLSNGYSVFADLVFVETKKQFQAYVSTVDYIKKKYTPEEKKLIRKLILDLVKPWNKNKKIIIHGLNIDFI